MREPSKWGRWEWPNGLGRWHAIVAMGQAYEVSGPTPKPMKVAMLACGRIRPLPKVMAGRPGPEQCCPACATLDDLRLAYKPETADEPDKVPVAVARADTLNCARCGSWGHRTPEHEGSAR
jgi:hypothetical protein